MGVLAEDTKNLPIVITLRVDIKLAPPFLTSRSGDRYLMSTLRGPIWTIIWQCFMENLVTEKLVKWSKTVGSFLQISFVLLW